ncbi:Bug family tripartite tricarboxylate transporter substrate binding protein [Falsiroseomonas sp. HW251]|uniref:Bug family tripartite tricarboxylate transporter substrate binding protein n=1 Tax=Falsiroseomonas sp. HW251 TaxID=3390998 RepID=UPI003D31DBC1
MTTTIGRRAALALPAVLAAGAARAQAWSPDRPVRIIVPFPPGNSTDAAARILAEALSLRLGRPVVVENKPGATTTIGAAEVARAAPDGHTLLLAPPPFVITQFAFPRLPYEAEMAFRPVGLVATSPVFLAVRADLPAQNVAELLALARAQPGRLTYASVGVGSLPNVAAELMKLRAGVDVLHVPYTGGGPAATDLVAGRVDMFFTVELEVKPYIDAGRVRLIGVATEGRLPGRPETMTLAEQGAALRAFFWIGFLAPARTPDAAVARINAEVNAVLGIPAIVNRLQEIALTASPSTPEAFGTLLTDERRQWSEAVRAANIRIE